MTTISFHTLGCKLNQAETEKFMFQFVEAGFTISADSDADVCILNTCTVTHIADRKSRHFVRLMKKNNPHSLIVAAGCYAQRALEDLKKAGADLIVTNDAKKDIVDLIKKAVSEKRFSVSDRFLKNNGFAGKVGHGCRDRSEGDDSFDCVVPAARVRSFIKIQDGCRNFCTYCVVPLVRDFEYSVPSEQIICEINQKISLGYQEAVLTGTEIGKYRAGSKNNQELDLKSLVRKILGETSLSRLHVSSLQPRAISNDFLTLWENPRMLPHFHLALQSGADDTLARMNRPYNIKDFDTAVNMIRDHVPGSSVTTDVIVGFPNESEQEFQQSYDYCKSREFAAIHVFNYSPRPGTAAADMKGQIDAGTKKFRSLKMLSLARQSSGNFRQRLIGQVCPVLFENEVAPGSGVYSGFTGNYVRVFVKSLQSLTNLVIPVKLLKNYERGLWGELLS